MPNDLLIRSGRGDYKVEFTSDTFVKLADLDPLQTQFIVDDKVFSLYKKSFDSFLPHRSFVLMTATESNKNVDRTSFYVQKLVENKVKLNQTLVAIGGGIVQDMTCFLASTLFRGMTWEFVPTTLLAQADSCIGSKSSINVGEFKNLMGTFYPPRRILSDISFLGTLDHQDLLSGIGEILKVHMIKGKSYFDAASDKYEDMIKDRDVLSEFIHKSLSYKKELIEIDEYDIGPRNVMNYGHSFGHAIESATDFLIPHGIAVTIGMDMANHQSYKMNRISQDQFLKWHLCLKKNYQVFSHVQIPLNSFLSAISKDKKNQGTDLSLILVQNSGEIEKVRVQKDLAFEENCQAFFKNYFSEKSNAL